MRAVRDSGVVLGESASWGETTYSLLSGKYKYAQNIGGGMSNATAEKKDDDAPETIILSRSQFAANAERLGSILRNLYGVPALLERIADDEKMPKDTRESILRITANAIQTELRALRIVVNNLDPDYGGE
jgi:hypothetical protein